MFLRVNANDVQQAEKIEKLIKAAKVDVEPFWPGLFAKALEGHNLDSLIQAAGAPGAGGAAPAAAAAASAAGGAAETKEEKKKEEEKKEEEDEESDDDMGFGELEALKFRRWTYNPTKQLFSCPRG